MKKILPLNIYGKIDYSKKNCTSHMFIRSGAYEVFHFLGTGVFQVEFMASSLTYPSQNCFYLLTITYKINLNYFLL